MGTAPIHQICSYNVVTYGRSALENADGSFNPAVLDVAQACGTKVVVILHGVSTDISAESGGIDLALFEDRINDFAGLIDPYVAGGTIISHLVIDEPHDCPDWNGVCPEPAAVDATSEISKLYWPTLETSVNTLPGYASLQTWLHTDRMFFAYAYHKGDLATFAQAGADVKHNGYVSDVSWAMQALSGGCATFGECGMTPAQVTEVGNAMCDTGVGGTVMFYDYSAAYVDTAMQTAINDLRLYCGDEIRQPLTPFALTGLAYADLDNDRVYDDGIEPLLPGAQVSVTTLDGQTTVTTVADAAGRYVVDTLSPISYTVGMNDATLPAGHFNATGGTLYMGLGLTTTLDFPVRVNGVSGIVYRDHNIDGAYSAENDTLYEGVVLNLTGDNAVSTTTTSSAAGEYQFRGLATGVYTVSVDSSTLDADWASLPAWRTHTITVTTRILAKDYGVQPPSAQISGSVYADYDNDRIDDGDGEPSLAGVQINLTNRSTGVVYSAISDATGFYQFSNLPGGTYGVAVPSATLPTGHFNVTTSDLTFGQTAVATLDFPIRINGVSGLVFRDNDLNALYDAGADAVYPNVDLVMLAPDGSTRTTTSNPDGTYEFRALASGTFTVSVDATTVDPGWASVPLQRANTFTVTTQFSAKDFAVQPPSGVVSGIAYADLNGDKVFDSASETVLAGVTINLTSDTTGAVYSAETAADGSYTITNLPGATYTPSVVESSLPDGHYNVTTTSFAVAQTGSKVQDFSIRLNGVTGFVFRDFDFDVVYSDIVDAPYAGVIVRLVDSADNAVEFTTGSDGTYAFRGLASDTYTVSLHTASLDAGWTSVPATRSYTLTRTDLFVGKDFAAQPPAGTISGLLYTDLDGNGLYDPATESPLPSTSVVLTATGDGSLTYATTDAAGVYSFNGLAQGGYTVAVDAAGLPVGHYNSSVVSVYISGATAATADFGVRLNGITGFVFHDTDFDGIYTAGVDTPYANAGVIMTGDLGAVYTTETVADGTYALRGVSADTYTIIVDPLTVLPGALTVPTSRVRVLTNTKLFTAQDYGVQEAAGAISGLVYIDSNRNNVYDAGTDLPMTDVTVKLTWPDATVTTAVSGSDGRYSFSQLSAGTYIVAVDATLLPPGHVSMRTNTVSLASGASNTTSDFPIRRNAVSGRVYFDANRNKQFDAASEQGQANRTVTATATNGTVYTAVTDAAGLYNFYGLPDGTYTIAVDAATLDPGHFVARAPYSINVQGTRLYGAKDFPIWGP